MGEARGRARVAGPVLRDLSGAKELLELRNCKRECHGKRCPKSVALRIEILEVAEFLIVMKVRYGRGSGGLSETRSLPEITLRN